MSVSTDGILAFGVDLGEEGEMELPWNENEEGFEEWLYKIKGVSNDKLWSEYYIWAEGWKTGDYLHDRDGVEEYERLHPEWKEALNKSYESQREALEACPVEEVRHCSGEYPMIILAVRGTVTEASRGYPVEIENLDVDPAAVQAAQEFCQEYKIPFNEPKWLLASHWN